MPKRTSLPSMLPPGCDVARRLIDAKRCDRRIARLLGRDRADRQRHEDHQHRRQDRPALPRVADHHAERVAQRRRDQQDRQHFQEVGQRRRVLERMRRVDVEEPAAVGAELLDGDLRRRRAHRQSLLGDRLPSASASAAPAPPSGRAGSSAPLPARPAATARTSDSGSRMYSVERTRSTQKLPIVCAVRRASPRISATKHRHAASRPRRSSARQAEHLREVAHASFRRRSSASWCWWRS